MCRLVVRDLADVCVYLSAPGDQTVVAARQAAPPAERDAHGAQAAALVERHRRVIGSGEVVIVSEIASLVEGSPAGGASWTMAVIAPVRTPDGTGFGALVAGCIASPPLDNGDVEAVRDVARRLASSLETARLRRQARELFETDLTGNFVAAEDGRLLDCNPAFARVLGYDRIEDVRDVGAAELFGGDVSWREFVGAVARQGRLRQQEMALRARDNRPVHALVSATGVRGDRGAVTAIRGQLFDLSAHKHLEEQLSQSQKMEAVGRLAGGIAHDFNNLLMIVGGQAGRLLEQLPEDDPHRRPVEAIATAADRAAGLTQQLLAFSRRQVLSPRVISLNTVARNVHGMLERLIGEDITCAMSLAEDIRNVRADPGRLEQALLNLAVNARDAMPGGGTLGMSTSNVEIDEAYSRQHLGAVPGRYVMLAVSDTGCGMDPETRTRVFEPFFTTKEVGKGTGLGLSMVYGIVKQSGGYIWVYSELGLGTTFKIYLPAVEAEAQVIAAPGAVSAPTGSETILLVEDEDGVRELLDELLTEQGYRVLSASRGADALALAERAEGEIELLVTDVVMPEMSGHELALRLRSRRPGLRVLYLSGYTDETIAHHGVLEPYAAFLGKPFTRAALATKVREVLTSDPPGR
jgi:PAS domain S-box-containing protein